MTRVVRILLRSTDRGASWGLQGVMEHKGGGSMVGMIALSSGRLVTACYRPSGKVGSILRGSEYYVPGVANFRFAYLESKQWGAYCDDEGKTWRYSPPMDIRPFQSASFVSSSQIVEMPDGTLAVVLRAPR